jgi:hypothetical protein
MIGASVALLVPLPDGRELTLCRALRECSAYYQRERNHQGLGNQRIAPRTEDLVGTGAVQRRGRLGGMLNFYRREAG